MPWDPAQYLKFAGPRLRPALDLLQRIDIEAPASVYDLGAGAGNVTRLIAARWPEARIVQSISSVTGSPIFHRSPRPAFWPKRFAKSGPT